jgi:hypothetical protein
MKTTCWGPALLLLSCAHVQPKDETVAQHRNEAAIHEARAARELAQYEPGDSVSRRPAATIRMDVQGIPDDLHTYNPTEEHVLRADHEMVERNEHLSAAHTLEQFEDTACQGLSAGERSSCPLLASSVAKLVTTKTGFRLELKPSVDAAQTYRRLNCHLAYAVASGFEAPSCPLFIKGTTLSTSEHSVTFSGPTVVAEALQAQARRVFLGEP